MSLVIGTTDQTETQRASLPEGSSKACTIHLNGTVSPSPYFRWKPWLDRVLAALLLVPGLLLMGLAALAVRLTSRGPAIYRQRRVGRNGRVFWFYKIRTMRCDAEDGEPLWATADDQRVTRVGSFLRRFHLDELPQLFNVLKGEMSLVGPRPERPEFVQVLLGSVAGYRHRMAVLPGVTGLAQLNLPPDTDLCCVCRKVVLDLDYVEHATLLLDLRILLWSARAACQPPGDHRRLPAGRRKQRPTQARRPGLARQPALPGHGACHPRQRPSHPPLCGLTLCCRSGSKTQAAIELHPDPAAAANARKACNSSSTCQHAWTTRRS